MISSAVMAALDQARTGPQAAPAAQATRTEPRDGTG
jgi:hypothetical protein